MSFIPSYKKPSGGGGYVPCSWSDGTDEEIIEALEKHYAGEVDLTKYWSVGDERIVTLSAMYGIDEQGSQDVVFVLSNVGGKMLADGITECAFQVDQKDCLNKNGYIESSSSSYSYWQTCARRNWCNSTYKNAIPSSIRDIFKEFINQGSNPNSTDKAVNMVDTFALRSALEVFGSTPTYAPSGEGSKVAWYETSTNRIKKRNGSNQMWWLRSLSWQTSSAFYYVYYNNGIAEPDSLSFSYERGIAPFGVI